MSTTPMAMRRDRRFYLVATIGILVIVFAGFARTWFLKGLFGTPALPALAQLHGLIMSSWLLLLLVQVCLIRAGRRDWHRRVGVFGALLAVAVVVVGVMTAINAVRMGHTPGPPPLVFLIIPLGEMVTFPLLVGAGVYFRRRSDYHKRFMLLSTLAILTPAIARFMKDYVIDTGIPLYFGVTDLCIVACIAYDTVKNRRLHPAFAWGGALVVAVQVLRLAFAHTATWAQIATWLIQ